MMLLVLGEVTLKVVGFDCAAGGTVLRIEVEHDPPTAEVSEIDGATSCDDSVNSGACCPTRGIVSYAATTGPNARTATSPAQITKRV
jgi:hypothetical protein